MTGHPTLHHELCWARCLLPSDAQLLPRLRFSSLGALTERIDRTQSLHQLIASTKIQPPLQRPGDVARSQSIRSTAPLLIPGDVRSGALKHKAGSIVHAQRRHIFKTLDISSLRYMIGDPLTNSNAAAEMPMSRSENDLDKDVEFSRAGSSGSSTFSRCRSVDGDTSRVPRRSHLGSNTADTAESG